MANDPSSLNWFRIQDSNSKLKALFLQFFQKSFSSNNYYNDNDDDDDDD